MNSLFSLKCVWRWFAPFAVMGMLLAAAACGSGGGITLPLGGNYTNGSLKGQYVISQTGIGTNQSGTAADHFSETIVMTADGNGNLNVTVDDFDQSGTTFSDHTTGTYSISRDGTGFLQFNYNPTTNYAITMIDDSHFYIIEQDSFATASGFGELQDTTAFTAPPSGNFVFRAHNIDTSSRVGGISVTAGAISGTEDLLNLGLQSTSNAVQGSFSATPPDSNGRGTFTLSDGISSTSFFYYVVGAGSTAKFHFLSNAGSLEIGQAEAQSGGPFSVATLAAGTSYVFGSSGDTSVSGAAGIHSAGVFSTDGNGNITGGQVDYVQDTTVNSGLMVTGGSYTLASNGRGQINLTLSGGTISPQIFWLVDGTHAYFLANSTFAVEDGTFTLQHDAPFSTLGNQAAFVMDGFDVAFKQRTGVFQPTTGGGFNWNQDSNSFDPNINDINFGGSPSSKGTNGSYQVSSNGRVVVTVNGVTNTQALVFYLSSASSGVMVQEDADIGGAFTVQAGQ